MDSRLARDETIVEAQLLEGRKALEIVERETKKEQLQFRAEVVEGFRFQQAQRDLDVQTSEVRDRILEKAVLALKERLESQRQEWDAQSKEQSANANRKLEEQKLAAATEPKKQREETTILFAQQTAEMKESMDNLLRQLHFQMAAYSIPPTQCGDGNPGPSSRGRQRNPSIPPDDIEKQSASTPNNDKGKGVDRGGKIQPPPPPPCNTGGDPDPDDDPDDDNNGEDDRGRKGGRPARAPRRPSIPRDASPRTQAMLIFMESLAVPIRPRKLIAEPPYFFQGEDNQGVRN